MDIVLIPDTLNVDWQFYNQIATSGVYYSLDSTLQVDWEFNSQALLNQFQTTINTVGTTLTWEFNSQEVVTNLRLELNTPLSMLYSFTSLDTRRAYVQHIEPINLVLTMYSQDVIGEVSTSPINVSNIRYDTLPVITYASYPIITYKDL